MPAGSVPSPRVGLVGRDQSLEELRAAVVRAVDGSPSVVLLSGETGVGKTALVREVTRDGRLTVLYGGCVPVASDPLPFAPLIQALRRLADSGAVRRQLERSPELARLLPGRGPSEPAGVVGQTATDSTKLALFQAVLELVERLGAPGPVLFAVEDVHWADRSTLDLLRYLATNLSAERLVLVVTYRADEILAGSSLAGWLAELGRLPITRRISLERLGRDDTIRLIGRLADDPDPALVRSTLARSAGNPLFVEHLLRQGSGVTTLPTTLHELLLARVSAHDPDTQSLLRLLAVLAGSSRIEFLADLLRTDPVDVERRIRPALDQHVLEIRLDDTIGFAHPAFGEVVYAGLLSTERVRLHRGAAEALDGTGQAAPGELARHWLAAGDRERALVASIAAGETAETMYAFADAQAAFARACGLARELGRTASLRGLLARTAQTAYLAGDVEEAIRLAEQALQEPGDADSEVHLFERLGAFHFVAGHGEQAERWLRRGLAGLGDQPPCTVGARIYARLALATSAWSKPDEAEVWCGQGLAAARAAGARREEGLVRNALGIVAALRGDVPAAIEHERAALAIAREQGGADDLALAYVNLTHVLGLAGNLDEVAEIGREGGRLLTRFGLASQFGSLLEANACEALINAGRLAEAEQLVGEALAHEPQGIMAAPALIQAGRLAALRGDLDLAWDRCERARLVLETEGAPDSWLRAVAEVAIDVELWAGHPTAAYELVIDQLHQLAGTDEEPLTGVLAALGLRALADQAERQRDPDSRRRIAGLRAPLDATVQQCAHSGLPHDAALQAWQAAERARIEGAATAQEWATVRQRWLALGHVIAAAYAAWREAEARLDTNADADAIAAVRDVHGTATRLGLALVAGEAQRLAGWHRIDLFIDPEPGSVSVGAADDPLAAYRLTEREREVLQALAAGLSNGEIATKLFISVKTASVHVSNILRKLNVSGRQEAARVAHRLGVGSSSG